jgi:hypothetical protein
MSIPSSRRRAVAIVLAALLFAVTCNPSLPLLGTRAVGR